METEMETRMGTATKTWSVKSCLTLFFAVCVTLGVAAQTQGSDEMQPTADAPPHMAEETGQGGTPPTAASSRSGAAEYSRDAFSTTMTGAHVVLGPGDELEITVFDTPELMQRVRVNSEGRITLQLVGEIAVTGMAPDELGKLVRRKLIDGNFMKDPQVSVFVLEYAGQMAYVTGEVARPGAYALLRSHRLLDLISLAGGLTPRAGDRITIGRGDDAAAQRLQVDLSDPDENRRNPIILPGDNISVSQTGVVYVLGDVQRPGGFQRDRRVSLSVLEAVALAQGTLPSAALSKVRLIRTTAEVRQDIPLNLKAILKSESPDPHLKPGDIVYVPGSLMRGTARKSVELIEQSAGLAAVYAVRP